MKSRKNAIIIKEWLRWLLMQRCGNINFSLFLSERSVTIAALELSLSAGLAATGTR